MSDDLNQVVDNMKQSSSWLRILFMIVFCIALYVAGIVVVFVMIAQALFTLLSGSDNRNLRRLGASLSEYVHDVLQFITYNSETRPFPFSPFPQVPEQDEDDAGFDRDDDDDDNGQDDTPAASSGRKPASPKPAARKRPARKTAARKKTVAKKAGDSAGRNGNGSDQGKNDSA